MSENETVTAEASALPRSVVQRANRKRFSFGPVWKKAVIEGKATDFAKLLEHGVKLNIGTRAELGQLKLAALRAQVAERLQSQEADQAKA